MEPVSSKCSCLNDLTVEQRKKADAVAGGSFEKLLGELQAVQSSFNIKSSDTKKGSLPEFKRPDDILNIFMSEEVQARDPGSDPFFLEKKFPLFGPSVIKTIVG